MIFGGVTPTNQPLTIELSTELGVTYFLERRELGVINIGGPGSIVIEGTEEPMKKQDGYYIGKETKEIQFKSEDPANPAKFYTVSVPAHHKYPNVRISIDNIEPMVTGDSSTLNHRSIYQYIHPNVCESCQLQMGYTILTPGSAWNTMPSHTHERRMETYLYFDMKEDTRVFHFMGKPDETKHLVISNEQAAISPSWSIHTGVGSSDYTFIWAMCGENITYNDMDMVPMKDLK
jgi:4-deoxy-L-threo-5-hexosulose-uronate ketol-isomerase